MYQLNHPNIVKLYNHWEDQDHLFLLMEYMGGGNLYNIRSVVSKIERKEIFHRGCCQKLFG